MSYPWGETRRRDPVSRKCTDVPIKDDVRLDMLPDMTGANPGDASP